MAVAARRPDLRRQAGNLKCGKNVVHNGFSCSANCELREQRFWQGVIRNGVRDENGLFFHECRLCRFFATALPALSQEPAPTPQYNVVTDAVLFDGGPSLGNSDKVRWDFYKADRTGARTETNAGGSYDATFEAKLPAGRYVGVAALGNVTRDVPFEVKDGSIARPKVNFDAAELTVVPKRSAGGEVETQAKPKSPRAISRTASMGRIRSSCRLARLSSPAA